MSDVLILALIEDDLVTLAGRVHRLSVADIEKELTRLAGMAHIAPGLKNAIEALVKHFCPLHAEDLAVELRGLADVAARISQGAATAGPAARHQAARHFETLDALISFVNGSTR